jgi:hypothetical protein
VEVRGQLHAPCRFTSVERAHSTHTAQSRKLDGTVLLLYRLSYISSTVYNELLLMFHQTSTPSTLSYAMSLLKGPLSSTPPPPKFLHPHSIASFLIQLIFPRRVLQLLGTANAVPSSLIFFILMMEAIRSSETSVLTRVTRRNILEDDILHNYRRENLISYVALTGWAL